MEYRLALSATPADPTLIADINTLPYGLPVNDPSRFVAVGSTVFFTASDDSAGVELWKTDGTVAGTMRVADISPGVDGSNPSALVAFKGSLYFTADDGTNGRELWKSDGTVAGTSMVKDVSAGAYSGLGFYDVLSTPQASVPGGSDVGPLQGSFGMADAGSMVVVNNLLFFVGADGETGVELWKSDGTTAGTAMVRDINTGTDQSQPDVPVGSEPQWLTAVGTTLYFSADDGVHGVELWKSDGSLAGTVLVSDINPSVDTTDPDNPSPSSSSPASLTNVAGTLYFTAYDDAHGIELWKSTGTAAGTVLVKDISSGDVGSDPEQLTAVGTTLYFTADNGLNGRELWKSTGTAAGTAIVRDINKSGDPEFDPPASSDALWLTAVGTTLFFTADDGVNGRELWKSTGTAAGTVMVEDIHPGSDEFDGTPYSSSPQWLTNVGGKLYFTASSSPYGPFYTQTTIWKSDGTSAGTVDVTGSDYETYTTEPAMLTPVGNTVYFVAAQFAPEPFFLFSLNTATGKSTQVLTADPTGKTADGISPTISSSSSFEQGFGSMMDVPDFPARDFVPFSGVVADPDSPNYGGDVYFAGTDGTNGYELWKTNGTAAGTVMVKDIFPGSGGSFPYGFTVVGPTMFFVARGSQGEELWKTDGTTAGTVLVKDISAGAAGSYPGELTVLGSTLFFTAEGGSTGRELWKSNGTAAGTVMVKNIRADVPSSSSDSYGSGSYLSSSFPQGLTVLGNKLYFAADDGIHGRELWQSDGTPTGTKLVVDVDETGDTWGSASYAASGIQDGLTLVGNTLFFAGTTSAEGFGSGAELWKSDGTAEGTMLVADLEPGLNDSSPQLLKPVGSKLFFIPRWLGGLWVSDGTEAGTKQVGDVMPLVDSDTVVGDTLYFVGEGVDFGSLWRSDGTAEGTVSMFDGELLDPMGLRSMFGSLYFTARDAVTGVRSMYAVDPTSTAGYSLIVDGTTFQSIAPIRSAFGTVLLGADDGQTGLELWKADAIGDKPTVTFEIDRTTFKKGDTATVTFTLSEASTVFTVSDVVVTGGSLSNFKGSGASYTATFTPTAQFIGAGAISVPSGSFLGVEGLANAAGALTDPLQIDTADPRVTISSDKSALKAGETATITFSLNKDSADFTLQDITATGGSLSGFSGSGASYSAIFTPTASSMVAGAISVAAGEFTDKAGNASVAGTLPAAIKIDTVVPTITITSNKSVLKIGEAATLTFTLSEPLTGFSLAGVGVGGGTLSTPVGSGLKYTAKFTPAASSTADGTITIPAAAGTDAAGNPSLAASLSPAIKIDTAAPTVTITSNAAALKAGETATINFSLSENATDFALADVTATGGTLANFTGSGSNYSAIFTPKAGSTAPGTISVTAAKFKDAAGNSNTQGSLSTPLTIDTIAPTLKITSNKAALKSGETATIAFALSEPASNFTAESLSATGGTLSGFVSLSSTSYTAVFTPAAGFTGTAGVVVSAGKFADIVGNPNVAGALAPTALKLDTAAPTLTITSSTASLNKAGTATISVKLSEASTTFNASTVKLAGGTLSGFSGKGDTYTFKFVPAANFVGTGTVSVAAGAFSDAAGNPSAAGASLAADIAIDTVVPTLTISSDKASLKAGETATITFKLGEDSNISIVTKKVSNFRADGGVLSNFSGSGSEYTATFTPNAGSTAAGKISAAAAAFTDAAGNPSLAGSLPTPLTINTVQPIVKITSEKTALKAGETSKITFAVSETVTDFTAGDIQVTGGSLSAFTGTGKSYSALFTPTASSVADGVISIAAGGLTNAVGNTNPVASLAAAIKTDTAVPTIMITSDLSVLTAGKTAKITFSLSEASTNFAAGDVTVTNGTLSAFAGSGTTYTATFTPKTAFSGTGRISVAAGKFTDKAGNNNIAGELADAITINTQSTT